MTTSRKTTKTLEKLRLPELWERFTELTGETTRSPNKKYLIRCINEVLEATEADPTAAPKRPSRPKAPKTTKTGRATTAKKHEKAKKHTKRTTTAPAATEDTPLSALSVADLRSLYVDVVGRPTGSSNASYLVWKIRQAQKGRVPVGPTRRDSSANPGDFKVIPLRMETAVVDQLDAARERLELPSRTALVRRALMLYLAKAGESDVAALLEQGQ